MKGNDVSEREKRYQKNYIRLQRKEESWKRKYQKNPKKKKRKEKMEERGNWH